MTRIARPDRPHPTRQKIGLRRRLPLGLALLLVTALAGCSILDGDDVLTLEVAETRLPCVGVAPQECLLVRSRPTEDFGLFYDGISGFDYEPGFRWTLRVTRHRVNNPPADGPDFEYRLVSIQAKQPSPRAELLAVTEQAQALWRASRAVDYTMVEERVCVCVPDGVGPVRIGVTRQDGSTVSTFERVTELHYVADNRVVSINFEPFFLSVQGLFSYLRYAIASDAHEIDVEFDDDTGYVRRLYVDWEEFLGNDEFEYIVHSLS